MRQSETMGNWRGLFTVEGT